MMADAPDGRSAQPSSGIVKDVINAKAVFDQGCKVEMTPAPPEVIEKTRAMWLTEHGPVPRDSRKLTATQRSVLYHLANSDYNMLAFDMAIWGPFGTGANGPRP